MQASMRLVRVLQSQIAMTPRGSYRTAPGDPPAARRATTPSASATRSSELDQRLQPAERGRRRRRDRRRSGARAGQDAVRSPARLRRRGEGAQERQGRLRHRGAGDRDLHRDRAPRRAPSAMTQTAKLAASIRADEEKMLERDHARDPEAHRRRRARGHQGRAVLRHHQDGRRRRRARAGKAPKTAARTAPSAKRSARQARKVPGVAQAEGQIKGAVASEGDLAIAALRQAHRGGDRRRSSPSSRRSTSRRSTPTSASTRTARRSSSRITHAARRRAVAGLRRAHRRRASRRPVRGRRRPHQGGPHLRARPQERAGVLKPPSASSQRLIRGRATAGQPHGAS